MITDPWFYLVAIPAVLLFGISKGGFGGAAGAAAVPLMALVVSPVQAAAILLPILCVMDIVALWKFRGQWVWPELKLLIPASIIGIVVGTILFEYMSTSAIRLILGIIAISFTLQYWLKSKQNNAPTYLSRHFAWIGGSVAGFTSFVAHSGGAPITMYLLKRPLNRTDFVATTVVFFAVVNYVKLVPYAWLGQFNTDNLATSAALVALAPIGVFIGIYLHKRISDKLFFSFVYSLLFIVGLKLTYEGLMGFI